MERGVGTAEGSTVGVVDGTDVGLGLGIGEGAAEGAVEGAEVGPKVKAADCRKHGWSPTVMVVRLGLDPRSRDTEYSTAVPA